MGFQKFVAILICGLCGCFCEKSKPTFSTFFLTCCGTNWEEEENPGSSADWWAGLLMSGGPWGLLIASLEI